MNTFLWIVASVLAVLFLVSGGMKVGMTKDRLRAAGQVRDLDAGAWTEDFSPGSIKAIGALEVLAAIGLVVPPALDIAPVLAPLAAVGLILIMVGAAITHVRRDEAKAVIGNFVYFALATVVAWGRFVVEPFTG